MVNKVHWLGNVICDIACPVVTKYDRCCLVDFDGEKIYDRFVRPKSFVTDFRTKYSGVRRCDLRKGEAVTLEEVTPFLLCVCVGVILIPSSVCSR